MLGVYAAAAGDYDPPTLENMCKRTTIPMYTKLIINTVFGWIVNPALSYEKYFKEEPFFDIYFI